MQQLDKEGRKWRIQVRAGDQRPSEIVFGTKTEARQREAELRAKYGRVKLKASDGETVGDYLPKWLKRTQRNAIAASTYERYDTNIRCQLIPTLGTTILTQLSSADILSAYQHLADGLDGQVYGPATIRKAHNVLKAALEDAVDDGKVRGNPAASRRIAKWLRGYGKKTPNKDMTPPPLKDVQALLTRMLTTATGKRLYGPCLLALDTGMSRGEFLALQWPDVDLERGVIKIQRAVSQTSRHGVIIKDTKTENRVRAVLLTRRATEYLAAWHADLDTTRDILGDRWEDSGWVFPNTAAHKGTKPGRLWLPTTFSMLLASESDRLGQHIEPHQLRRLHATIMEHAGVPQTEIAARLGHGGTAVTQRHYLFAIEDGQRAAVETFEAALAGAPAQ